MSVDTMFLVLSDLHFGRDLYEAPEMPLICLARKLNWFAKEEQVRDAFAKLCLGHDIACIMKLPFYLRFLIEEAKNQGFQRDTFDLCLLLGDQVTIPDAKSYKFLREYLTKREYRTTDGYVDHRCSGLAFSSQQILAIPGNHDKLLRTDLELYNRQFSIPLGLTPRLEAQSCGIAIRKFDDREFIFVLVDAGKYATEELQFDLSSRDHLASGEVTPELSANIRGKLISLKTQGGIDGFALEGPYANAAKILLIHFPVDYDRFTSVVDWKGKVLRHDCTGLPQAIQAIQEEFGLDVVLHGHLHQPSLYNYSGVQVVAATTAAQQHGNRGFYVLKVSDTGQMYAEHHYWNGVAFAGDPNYALSGPLAEIPRFPPLEPAA
jgi:predicted phosphodiesterase